MNKKFNSIGCEFEIIIYLRAQISTIMYLLFTAFDCMLWNFSRLDVKSRATLLAPIGEICGYITSIVTIELDLRATIKARFCAVHTTNNEHYHTGQSKQLLRRTIKLTLLDCDSIIGSSGSPPTNISSLAYHGPSRSLASLFWPQSNNKFYFLFCLRIFDALRG
jgi:hypothetical protein